MPKVLVSNNGELLQHFAAPPFHRMDLELVVARGPDEAKSLFDRDEPSLVVLDVEQGGFATAKAIKAKSPSTRVILVATMLLTSSHKVYHEP